MAGVTSTGFVAKTLTEIKESLRSGYRTVLGAAVNVAETSRNGQVISNFAAALSEVWDLGEAITSVFSQPTGAFLDFVASLTGTFRNAATFSTVNLILTGTNGTSVPSGRQVNTTGTAAAWLTDSTVVLATATAWATGTVYAKDVVRRTAGGVYVAIQGGTSAGSGSGPLTQGQDITDGTVHWRWMGAGAAYAAVSATATVTGPIQGYASSVNVIATPVAGWQGVNNAADATVGRDLETDSALRSRRAVEVAGIGTTPIDAIRAAVLRVPGVTSCSVFENTTDATVNGIAPHRIEVLVEGGADDAVAQAIFNTRAAGIGTSGTTTGTAVDATGANHVQAFSRPTTVDVWVIVNVAVGPGYPADGDAQVAEAIVAAGDALGLGYDVWATFCAAQAFTIPGVLNTNGGCLVGTVDPPASASVAITPRQRAGFDTGRVTVVSTTITP